MSAPADWYVSMSYQRHGRGDGIPYTISDTPIASVHEVSFRVHRDNLIVWVHGSLLKRNGEASHVSRCTPVDLDVDQPRWLAEIIADARARLEGVR